MKRGAPVPTDNSMYGSFIRQTKVTAQRQDSLTEQLLDLVQLANEHGMYDAADWITRTLDRSRKN